MKQKDALRERGHPSDANDPLLQFLPIPKPPKQITIIMPPSRHAGTHSSRHNPIISLAAPSSYPHFLSSLFMQHAPCPTIPTTPPSPYPGGLPKRKESQMPHPLHSPPDPGFQLQASQHPQHPLAKSRVVNKQFRPKKKKNQHHSHHVSFIIPPLPNPARVNVTHLHQKRNTFLPPKLLFSSSSSSIKNKNNPTQTPPLPQAFIRSAKPHSST